MGAIGDDAVVLRCQAGDQDAFQDLVQRYGDALFGAAYLMTRDYQLAEDLTQEALVDAWRGMAGFRRGAPLKPWLMRILVNRVISHRRRKVFGLLSLPKAERLGDMRPGPEGLVERWSEHEEMRRALLRLSPAQQRLLVLRFFAELSVPEIARALRWPEGTVKSRLHRALQRMRTLLEEPHPTDEAGAP